MRHIGLALSGGGFRATLYHLGVVRFLRDAHILPKITHMTTVSGGSIIGAHLALNWDRYCGADDEFDQAAAELIRFVQLDVRNRILRRFPFASTGNTLRRLLRLGTARQLTRAGLLEMYYERFLFGDTALSELPDRPQLHILATNLSEGCLCSFHQGGLLFQRRTPGRRDRFERVHVGLATVPMAVAASSAFPGFFPPLELSGRDAGTEEGAFARQAFTDGGIYDNLGLRMFRCIEQESVRDVAPLRPDDFLELDAAVAALQSASRLPDPSPLRRLWEKLAAHEADVARFEASPPEADTVRALIRGLWEIIRTDELFADPVFENMELGDPTAQSLLQYVRTSKYVPELSDRLWLNREIVASALRQVVGKPCLRASRDGFDAILVSDAGGKFKVANDGRAGGLIRTAFRSSDIIMDRVWQLELEAFANTPGVFSIPIATVVQRCQDPLAPHPEIQRQAARIRTDLDSFSPLEISALVQHGYCVARTICRAQTPLVDAELPAGAPWDPLAEDAPEGATEPVRMNPLNDDRQALSTARRLQRSASRRTWSTLLSFRDWSSYVWVPLFALVAFSLPYTLYQSNKRSQRQQMVLSAIAETSPVYRKILELLERGPARDIGTLPCTDVTAMEPPDFSGFEIVSDTRIFDLRRWLDPATTTWSSNVHVRLRVRRTEQGSENTHLRFQTRTIDEGLVLFSPTESLTPTLTRMQLPDETYLWQLDLDFSHVPIGGDTEFVLDGSVSADSATLSADEGRFTFTIPTKAGLVQIWMLMPVGRQYEYFQISGHPLGKPESSELVVPNAQVELPFGSIATFQLINPKENYRYECRWKWSTQSTPSY
ncbi:MAG: patatin-like phospholipase family protein [Pirellulales bacterium]